MQLIMLVQSLD
ncbi:hypothetical protein Zm00014a_020928 [Zea mays]|uniref:Uncharacterized protein n=1 Tax=Zea mays TaxID=4577 RepID=A0A3L6E1G4_MAIZE|nr:hypothetical protein Zm00014a_020928 [Zea mays]